MDPVPRLILHHVSVTGLVLEVAVVAGLVALFLAVWLKGRRREASSRRAVARMRDDEGA